MHEAVDKSVLQKFQHKEALVGVIGLGYVGLPLVLAFSEAGLRTLGFDVDPKKIETLNRGESYLRHINADRIKGLSSRGYLAATGEMHRLSEPDAILLCVPTPLTRHLEPDLSYVLETTELLAKYLRHNQLIILESTTYPGTTTELLKPIIEKSGHEVGRSVFLAYSPEREDPGNLDFSTVQIPKVVGADDERSLELAVALYDHIVPQTIAVSSSMTAEAVKITENVFRAVNIALVNELKMIFSAMGIDVWEVIEAAKTKPFGYMPFYPGPGLGGHCIPIDPFYLTWKAREYGLNTRFIELAGQINTSMPEQVVLQLARALDLRMRKGLNGSKVLVIGVAYKKNVADVRESPSLKLMGMLEARGVSVDFYDPLVAAIPITREYPQFADKRTEAWDVEKFAQYDAVLIGTDHDEIDYLKLATVANLVIDTRNACRRAGADLSHVVPA